MNTLTVTRDLVYQKRFTESFRLILFCKSIGLPYIKGHSGNLNPIRKLIWLDYGYGYGYGRGDGDGYGYSWGSGSGYGSGDGYGWGYGRDCPWKRI